MITEVSKRNVLGSSVCFDQSSVKADCGRQNACRGHTRVKGIYVYMTFTCRGHVRVEDIYV